MTAGLIKALKTNKGNLRQKDSHLYGLFHDGEGYESRRAIRERVCSHVPIGGAWQLMSGPALDYGWQYPAAMIQNGLLYLSYDRRLNSSFSLTLAGTRLFSRLLNDRRIRLNETRHELSSYSFYVFRLHTTNTPISDVGLIIADRCKAARPSP